LKDLPVKDKPVQTMIVVEEGQVNVEPKLKTMKTEKRAIPDEKVKWSSTSSLDEHTHENDGYSFYSNDEDVDLEKQRKVKEVKVDKKGKKKVEEPESMFDILTQVMNDVEPMKGDPIVGDVRF